jgi:hypothetical protein
VILYSDGISNRSTAGGRWFGLAGIERAARAVESPSAVSTARSIQEAVVNASEKPMRRRRDAAGPGRQLRERPQRTLCGTYPCWWRGVEGFRGEPTALCANSHALLPKRDRMEGAGSGLAGT